jgi:hypothetical protein
MGSIIGTYLGIGLLSMAIGLGLHLRDHTCSKSAGYHVFDAAVRIVVWPLYVVVFLVTLTTKLRR